MLRAALVWALSSVLLFFGLLIGLKSLGVTGLPVALTMLTDMLPTFLLNPLLALMIGGLGIVIFLGTMLYLADSVSMLDKKIHEYERKFSSAVENLTQTKVRKERSEAQRDLAEGVHSVLHNPLSQIRSHISVVSAGLSADKTRNKAIEIAQELDRVDKFLDSLRRSSNPGQISQPRCEPEKILKQLLPDWLVRVKKYGATVNEKITYVHEISIPERDVRTIMKGVLEFFAERLSRNLYQKNVVVSLQPEQSGIHLSVMDNQKLAAGELKELVGNNVHLAIANGTLERNGCQLEIEEVLEGGIRISFDLVKSEDQNLDSLTAVSRRLKI